MPKPRAALIIGIITVVIMLITAFAGCASENPLLGAWHSEEQNQLLHFYEDGTVVFRTAERDYLAEYVFDQSKGSGMITLNGEALTFSVQGDSLLLTRGGTGSVFARGEMEIAIAEASSSEEATPAAETQVPTPETAEESQPDAETSATATINPDVLTSVNEGHNGVGGLVGETVVGTWCNDSIKLTFSEGVFQWYTFYNGNWVIRDTGIYEFNNITGEGSISGTIYHGVVFTVDGDTMLLDDTYTLARQ